HKTMPAKPVSILHEDPIRYNPSDLEEAPWLVPIEELRHASTGHKSDFPPASIHPMVEGCAWLRHCRDDAATLPEPQWYALLGILGRCEDGEQLAHTWSQPYPGYAKEETAAKLQQ